MTSYMNIAVEATSIGQEMSRDVDFAYDILNELAYQQSEVQNDRFVSGMFRLIFEDENDLLLGFLSHIVKEFEHLKEENNE